LSRSTVFGIRNTVGWVFRIDRPHRGATYDHINYNTFFTGQPDPHDRLPYGVVPTLGAISTFSNLVGKIITFVAMAADALL